MISDGLIERTPMRHLLLEFFKASRESTTKKGKNRKKGVCSATYHCHDDVPHVLSILFSGDSWYSISRCFGTVNKTLLDGEISDAYLVLLQQTPKFDQQSVGGSGRPLQPGRYTLHGNRCASVPWRFPGS